MLLKFLLSLVIWLVVAIVLRLVGALLGGDMGVWLQVNNVLIGFLAAVLYFFFGNGWYPAGRV